jgi:hypothetical protein
VLVEFACFAHRPGPDGTTVAERGRSTTGALGTWK